MTTPKTKTKRPSKMPVCAACGKKLRKMRTDSRTNTNNNHLAARSLRLSNPNMTMEEYRRVIIGTDTYKNLSMTCDSMPPTRGTDGNNVVCHRECGHLLLVRLLITLGTDVLAHLPECWRFRSS